MAHAAGEKVRRLTLLEKMGKSATSSATKMMVTNSGKYGITTGSYAADFFELTPIGAIAVNPSVPERERRADRILRALGQYLRPREQLEPLGRAVFKRLGGQT